jgi:putative chitinase
MTDWHSVIRAVCPHGRASIVEGFAASMPMLAEDYDISTPLRQAHFIAQCCHESAGFATLTEYASGAAYEGRRDLGNTRKGDGPRYKGRAPLQLTGRANYSRVGQEIGVDLVGDPDKAAEFPVAARICGVFWRDHHINGAADRDDARAVTRIINGGYNGLASREAYLVKAKRALGARAARLGIADLGDDEQNAAPASPVDVKEAQRRLKGLGYFPGAIDGDLGPAMAGSLSTFQKERGLSVTGELDPATVAALGSQLTGPRDIPPARADVTVDDLRAKGSDTIAAADDADDSSTKAALGTVVSAGTGAFAIAKSTMDNVQQVKDAVDPGFFSWGTAHWPLILAAILVPAILYVGYYLWRAKKAASKVRTIRTHDHATGAHMGR